MDQPYHGQIYLFMLSTTTFFTDITSNGDLQNFDWFAAQEQCSGFGLTTEKNKSDKPYWTGNHRRLTPWISILGCYSDSLEDRSFVVKKTMIMSSVGICQEICHHENLYKFALKMNSCLCIESKVVFNPSNKLPPSACNYTCEDNSDTIYSRDCGGENAYNLFEIQRVRFNTVDKCLSLQCSRDDTRFIPRNCSKDFGKVCENFRTPDQSTASSWNISMDQCRKSRQSAYLLGEFLLNKPKSVCENVTHQIEVVWVGVARQKYKSIDQGRRIIGDGGEFQDCQMCTKDICSFISCNKELSSSVFCRSISDTSQSQITSFTMSQENSSTSILNHSASKETFTPTTGYNDKDQISSKNDTEQKSSAKGGKALKISISVIVVFITLLSCSMAVVFYTRWRNMPKTAQTKKAEVEHVAKNNIYSDNEQNSSYFVLEQCSPKMIKGKDLLNESPYNESEEGVYDHLRDKQSRRPEEEDTYQHALVGVSIDLSEYDTMANAHNKDQEEESSYDYTHTDKNKNYRTDSRAQNHLTDNPYDVAV